MHYSDMGKLKALTESIGEETKVLDKVVITDASKKETMTESQGKRWFPALAMFS
jgi:hypothetical protein